MESWQRLPGPSVVPPAGVRHDTVMTTVEGDFYEDDEPLEKILSIWESSPKTLTVSPSPSHGPSASLVVLDREVYTMSQAARLLGVQAATLRRWIDGYTRGGVAYEPVIRPRRTGSENVTWGEFVEAGYLREYRVRHRVSLRQLRPVVQMLRDRLGVPYPLAHARPYVANRDLVLDVQQEAGLTGELAMVVLRNGQLMLAPGAEAFLQKVDFEPGGVAVRLYPDNKSSPVVFDPLHDLGEPTVSGIRTASLYSRFVAGESIATIAGLHKLSDGQVEAAIRYESRVRGHQPAA